MFSAPLLSVGIHPSGVRLIAAELVGTQPSPDDDTLWPSDHFGVLAEFSIGGGGGSGDF